MKYFSLNRNAVSFTLRILLGCIIAWCTLDWLHDTKKIWALISVIVVSDPDFENIRKNVLSRMVNTIVGGIIGLVFIYFFGVSFWVMMAAVAIAVIVATSFKNYPSSWKMAPVTVVILLIPVSPGPETLKSAMSVALTRAGEVLYGSLVALLLGLLYYKLGHLIDEKPVPVNENAENPVSKEISKR